MPSQQQHVVRAERAGVRGTLLRRAHQQIRIAEFIPAVPERHLGSQRPAEVKERDELHARRAKGQHGSSVVVTDGMYVGTGFVDIAVTYLISEESYVGRYDLFGIERHSQNVGWFDEFRGTMPRNKIATWIVGIAHADVPKRIDDAFVGEDAVGNGELVAQFGECVGHGFGLSVRDTS